MILETIWRSISLFINKIVRTQPTSFVDILSVAVLTPQWELNSYNEDCMRPTKPKICAIWSQFASPKYKPSGPNSFSIVLKISLSSGKAMPLLKPTLLNDFFTLEKYHCYFFKSTFNRFSSFTCHRSSHPRINNIIAEPEGIILLFLKSISVDPWVFSLEKKTATRPTLRSSKILHNCSILILCDWNSYRDNNFPQA